MLGKSPWRQVFSVALTAWVVASCSPLDAQIVFQDISEYDLIGGRVPTDQMVQTSGHVWIADGKVFMAASVPSALAPIELDISNVSSEITTVPKSRCSASSQFVGGCAVKVRGRTKKGNRPSLSVVSISFDGS